MNLQTFPTEKEKPMISKLFRVLVIILLIVVVAILLDATNMLAQSYALEYGKAPDSIVQGAVDYLRSKL